ncbi:hypothetical protein FRX31_018154 [Thalictrum thalictroides]|uniref:Uncharacterized protein n=1 Tax=Thalictrum thalictroides TaxID=46969 RepID=A0A7J6W4G4_THATH|nr:hypothetical protein FRX31_018154 [Thalictrum thalictroides]
MYHSINQKLSKQLIYRRSPDHLCDMPKIAAALYQPNVAQLYETRFVTYSEVNDGEKGRILLNSLKVDIMLSLQIGTTNYQVQHPPHQKDTILPMAPKK